MTTETMTGTASAAVRPVTTGGRAGLLWAQVRAELVSTARTGEFLVGAIAIPALLYAMIGLPAASRTLPDGSSVGAVLLVSWTSYGVVSLALFTFGEYVAHDRRSGWTRTMRTTPLPWSGYLAAKVVVGLVAATAIVVATGLLAATLGGVEVGAAVWLRFVGTMLAGLLCLAPIGFAIAYLARPRAAATVANVVFLPLSFLSGFFVPLQELPRVVQQVAVVLPSHHLGQLAWRQFASPADVATWLGRTPAPLAVNVAVLLAGAAVFGLLAVLGARREAVLRRG